MGVLRAVCAESGHRAAEAVRYARHVGEALDDAAPEEALDAVREELPPKYWELSERVLADPHYYGSFERRPDSLEPSDVPIPGEG